MCRLCRAKVSCIAKDYPREIYYLAMHLWIILNANLTMLKCSQCCRLNTDSLTPINTKKGVLRGFKCGLWGLVVDIVFSTNKQLHKRRLNHNTFNSLLNTKQNKMKKQIQNIFFNYSILLFLINITSHYKQIFINGLIS